MGGLMRIGVGMAVLAVALAALAGAAAATNYTVDGTTYTKSTTLSQSETWDDYELAVCDMVDRTSTSIAPWTLIEANNKYFARIKVLKTLCGAIENALDAIKVS